MAGPSLYLYFYWLLVLPCCLCGGFGNKPRIQSVSEGSTIKLSCAADGVGITRAVRGDWFLTRRQASTARGRRLAQRQRYYTISEAEYKDSGYYKCVGSSAQIVSLTQVIVGSAPVITNPFDFPTKQYALANEEHILQCYAKGTPQPMVKWYRNFHRLRTSRYHNVTTEIKDHSTEQRTVVRVTLTLLKWIAGVSEGTYQCRATNIFGSDRQSTVVELTSFKGKDYMPTANLIINSSKNVEIFCGQKGFILTCLSYQFHYIHWEKEGVRIDKVCSNSSTQAGGGVCISSELIQGYELGKLQFGRVNHISKGVYRCVSTSFMSLGISVSDQVTVTLTGLPVKPYAVPLDDACLDVYTEQDSNNKSGFVTIPCLYMYNETSKGGSVDVEWFNSSGRVVEHISQKRVVRILQRTKSKRRYLFAARQQGQQSVYLYIRGDHLAYYQGNYTCRASSTCYDGYTILREIRVMSEHS